MEIEKGKTYKVEHDTQTGKTEIKEVFVQDHYGFKTMFERDKSGNVHAVGRLE